MDHRLTLEINHQRSRSSWEYRSGADATLQGGGASLLDSYNMALHAVRRHLSVRRGRDVSMEEAREATHHTMQRGEGPVTDLRLPGSDR